MTAYTSLILSESNLAAFWPLNEPSGTTINDISGNNKNGTLTSGSGVVTIGNAGLLNFDTSTAATGTGASNTGYITTPSMGITGGTNFSIEFWFYPTGGDGTGTIISTNGAPYIQILWYKTTYKMWAYSYVSAGHTDTYLSSNNATINTRNHIVLTYDGTKLRWYINGVLDASSSYTASNTISLTNIIYMFRLSPYWGTGSILAATLQNVAVYTKALSASSVAFHYAVGNQRVVSATAALLQESSRTVPSTAALLQQSSRTVPANAALLQSSSRIVPSAAALLQQSTRTVPGNAALLQSSLRTVPSNAALIQESYRTVPGTAALLQESSRIVPATASLWVPPRGGTVIISDAAVSVVTARDAVVTTCVASDSLLTDA